MAVGALCVLTPAIAEQNVVDLMMKVQTASQEVNYSGTFVYHHNGDLETMRVIHKADDGIVKERIFSLNGALREIIRDEERVWCYLPEQKMGVHEYRQTTGKNFPSILPQDMERLFNHYIVKLGDPGRIANRTARRISIQPKDDFRYGYELWADSETGLLLRADLLDQEKNVIEQYAFVEIAINTQINEQDLQPITPRNALVWFGPKDPATGKESAVAGWKVTQMPSGFILSRDIKRMSPMREQPMEHRVYSDGLASVSVFIEQLRDNSRKKAIKGLSQMGAVHAFGTMIDDYQITVMGEVPEATVSLIGASVELE